MTVEMCEQVCLLVVLEFLLVCHLKPFFLQIHTQRIRGIAKNTCLRVTYSKVNYMEGLSKNQHLLKALGY